MVNMYEDLLESIQSYHDLLIYGAGGIATEFAENFLNSNYDENINFLGFAVTYQNGNVQELLGYPVHELSAWNCNKKDTAIILALNPLFQPDVRKLCKNNGYEHLFSCDSYTMEQQNHLFRKMTKQKLLIFRQKERNIIENDGIVVKWKYCQNASLN